MQLTFLVENNSLVSHSFLSESALSMLIEDGESRILFDAGYSDAFLKNAQRMGQNLRQLNWIVLSHGHFDHTWGLDVLIRHYFESISAKLPISRPTLLAHPQAFTSKAHRGEPEIGMMLTEDKLARHFDIQKSAQPIWLTDKLVTLGQIERVLDFEPPTSLGTRLDVDGEVDDFLPDDTAMAYVTGQGLVVIAGCAHAGICNTVEQAKRVTGIERVHTVLGGFHLQKTKPERLDPTTDYLAALELNGLYACHCTDLAAKIGLARKCPIVEVGSGLSLTF
jgi:7,8-dihydropterin-6-yl-methyl-4-(beta-D-ribofuranosyl)aminobenzene 5'-phosphate synthase